MTTSMGRQPAPRLQAPVPSLSTPLEFNSLASVSRPRNTLCFTWELICHAAASLDPRLDLRNSPSG